MKTTQTSSHNYTSQMVKDQISISVIMITYAHEKYIKQAVESILNQKTNFLYEVIISDDNSPDNTESVINKIIKENPNGSKINYTKHTSNKGMNENYFWSVTKCRGELIAVCEGDDYWTDPLKLQNQFNFLKKNKDYSMVFTPALRKFESSNKSNKIRNRYFNYNPNDFQLENILKLGGGFYPTCSSIYRKNIYDITSPRKFMTLHSTGDYPIAILAAIKGKIGYIDDVTSVYRVQDNSVSNKLFKTCEDCIKDVKTKYEKNINFLNFLFKEIKIKKRLERELLSKENYILLSKYLNCSHYSGFSNLFFKLNLSINHRLKIIAKIIYLLIIGNKQSKIQKGS